jgi:hypothetical protein
MRDFNAHTFYQVELLQSLHLFKLQKKICSLHLLFCSSMNFCLKSTADKDVQKFVLLLLDSFGRNLNRC